ncbi:copper amine oxidase N-terminal domain-containing protein [Paenibacillus sp. GP183]|uniref:copper amine oxidase N-terminal domain-containing protein n=1 Tax=Paenibacillus sp. GP183 TaxID=1882751 RepID=UPI00149605E8|nr:copper amine oxidase N-terminal domain-containing protein [Paenibacillus sp. GP183]
MKKILKVLVGISLAGTMLLAGGASVGAAENGDTALRAAVESMNGTLGWMSDTQQITVDVAGSKAMLKIGSADATIMGQAVKLNKAPYISEGSTLISAATLKQLQDALKNTDKLLFTFSSVGDSRIDKTVTDASAQDSLTTRSIIKARISSSSIQILQEMILTPRLNGWLKILLLQNSAE